MEERITISFPEYIYAVLKVDKDNQKDQLYDLNVLTLEAYKMETSITLLLPAQ